MMRPFFGLAFLIWPALAMTADHPVYRWVRAIQLPELKETKLVSIPLDSHFFQQTRQGRPDVRLYDHSDAAVGYVIRTVSETKARTVRKIWVAQQTAAKVDSAIGLQIQLELRDKEDLPQGLRIMTPLRDFEHQVKVESSADGTTWSANGSPTVIFDYSRFVDARNDLIALAPTTDRHFRVTIEDVTADQESQLLQLTRRLRGSDETERTERSTISRRPFRVDKIEFYRDEPASASTGEPLQIEYKTSNFAVKENAKEHQSVLTFESQKEPITKIKIVTTSENFSRTAQVETQTEDSNGQTEWRSIAQGTFTRFAVGSIQRESLSIEIPETSTLKYRVTITNGDSPPLLISGIEAFGKAYEVMFLASPGQELELEYGSPDAQAGRFDTAALEAAIRQPQQSVSAGLGPPRETKIPLESWKPWNDSRVLTGGILVLTLILGWGLLRAGHQMKDFSNQ